MRRLLIVCLCLIAGCQAAPYLIAGALQGMGGAKQQTAPAAPARTTQSCFAASETEDGVNKICYYDCVSGRAAVTVSVASICPATIQQ